MHGVRDALSVVSAGSFQYWGLAEATSIIYSGQGIAIPLQPPLPAIPVAWLSVGFPGRPEFGVLNSCASERGYVDRVKRNWASNGRILRKLVSSRDLEFRSPVFTGAILPTPHVRIGESFGCLFVRMAQSWPQFSPADSVGMFHVKHSSAADEELSIYLAVGHARRRLNAYSW